MASRPERVASWEHELEVMVRHLGAQRAALAGQAPPPPPYEPPGDLGPLPGHLAGRAAALLADTRSLEDQVAESRRAIGGLLRALDRQPTPLPAYVDERA